MDRRRLLEIGFRVTNQHSKVTMLKSLSSKFPLRGNYDLLSFTFGEVMIQQEISFPSIRHIFPSVEPYIQQVRIDILLRIKQRNGFT